MNLNNNWNRLLTGYKKKKNYDLWAIGVFNWHLVDLVMSTLLTVDVEGDLTQQTSNSRFCVLSTQEEDKTESASGPQGLKGENNSGSTSSDESPQVTGDM